MSGRPHLRLTLSRSRRRATALGVVLPVLLVAGCGGPVELDTPDLDATDQAACQAFTDDLPDTLAGEDAVEFEPADALGGAYGDPAITVTCGVPTPPEFDEFSSCEVANGVGWYVPDEQFDDADLDITLTTAGYSPAVEIRVPSDYRSDNPDEGDSTSASAIAELAAAVTAHTKLVQRCS